MITLEEAGKVSTKVILVWILWRTLEAARQAGRATR